MQNHDGAIEALKTAAKSEEVKKDKKEKEGKEGEEGGCGAFFK